jgi:glycine cleavage system regulatory protein
MLYFPMMSIRGAMQTPLVMTIIGADRTGLVESVARLVAEHGGNWLESRMCRLGGKFAGILRIVVPRNSENALVEALGELRDQGLSVIVNPDQPEFSRGLSKTASLSLIGHDRPGIIHQISAALAHQGINVEELETECSSAPMSGETIFKAYARLQIPESCDTSDLRRELEEIGSELMVDISFSET